MKKVVIRESERELKQLLHAQTRGRFKERIQALYLLKKRGVYGLLELKHGGGKPLSLPPPVLESLRVRLQDHRGFSDYQEIQPWLRTHYGIEIPYKTLWGIVHQRLKSRPKVVRPQSMARDDSKAVDLKKKAFRLSLMATLYSHDNAKIRYWCQDETRLGLKTITRRRITRRGVKPYGQVQWSFQAYYIYGTIEPLTGDSWFLKFSHLNTDCFQAYLNEFSPTYPNDLHIIQTDNATCHTAKRLVISANVILWFQPAPSPDCNPIEQFWAWVKGKIAWNLFEDLEHLKQTVSLQLNSISHSITGKERLIADLAIINNQILYTDFFY